MECFFKKSLEYSKELQKVLRGIRSIGNTFGEGTDEYEEELQKVLNDIHSIENTLDNIFLERSREYKEKFGKLLDEVYLTCPRGQMVHDWVKFPDSDELKGKRDENIFPDKYEREYAEKTQIDEIPAIDYIKELAAHSGISNIDDSEFILFVQRMLPIYCRYESGLESIELGKFYDARIAKADINRFGQQAVNCAEMYACLSAVQALHEVRRKDLIIDNSEFLDEFASDRDRVEKATEKAQARFDSETKQLQSLFYQHHILCGSCRSRLQDDKTVEDFCHKFSVQIFVNRKTLYGNPLLIFRLWTTVAQTPFAEESSDSLAALLDRKCQTKQSWEDPKVEKADRELYNGLLKFCLPNRINKVWKKGYQKLFKSDGRSGVPISELCRRKAEEHIGACLPFLPLHLYGCKCYSRRVIENEDVCHWLEQKPLVLERLSNYLNNLKVSDRKELHSSFRQIMEKPSECAMEKWLGCIENVVKTLPWRELSEGYPQLKTKHETAKTEFTEFLISWILLQENITESKIKLREIFKRITKLSIE